MTTIATIWGPIPVGEDARAEGVEARRRGLSRDECPYTDERRCEWLQGWWAGGNDETGRPA